MTPTDLDQLHSLRTYRDIGTYILIAGVIIEGLIDIFWKDTPSIITWDTRTEWQKFCAWWTAWRNRAVVLALALVAIGIAMEMVFGDWADDKTDQMRANLEAETAHLDADSTKLQAANLTLQNKYGPRHFGIVPQPFLALRQFSGVELLIQAYPSREAYDFTNDFIDLSNAGWKIREVGKKETGHSSLNIVDGVWIFSWPYPETPKELEQSLLLGPPSPARALSEYMRAIGIQNTCCMDLRTNFPSLAHGKVVLIQIGRKPAEITLSDEYLRSRVLKQEQELDAQSKKSKP